MSGGGKMACSECGRNITMDGAPMCDTCDPDIGAIIERQVERKTPDLCGDCFAKHVVTHERVEKWRSQPRCGNCHEPLNADGGCFRCGHSVKVGAVGNTEDGP